MPFKRHQNKDNSLAYLRFPKSTQEKRLYYQYKELVRAKRNPLHLPNVRDIYFRKIQRNWKSQRLNQYK